MTDLLYLIYSEVKRRGGIYKMHADFANQPLTGGLKVYDYLWVGENVDNADGLREAVKNHAPYVVPCIHGIDRQGRGRRASTSCTRFPTCSSRCCRAGGR